jgi:hypothetical protein
VAIGMVAIGLAFAGAGPWTATARSQEPVLDIRSSAEAGRLDQKTSRRGAVWGNLPQAGQPQPAARAASGNMQFVAARTFKSLADETRADETRADEARADEARADEPRADEARADGVAAATTGISPYADWDDHGMRPLVDLREAREDVTESQRRQINAAYGNASYRAWEHCVAGHPTYLRRHAHPSDTGRYFGYQVGGGTIFPGTGRDLDEGTFGWDYVNPLFPARVALGWSHRREQGGTGAYATDHKKRGE